MVEVRVSNGYSRFSKYFKTIKQAEKYAEKMSSVVGYIAIVQYPMMSDADFDRLQGA